MPAFLLTSNNPVLMDMYRSLHQPPAPLSLSSPPIELNTSVKNIPIQSFSSFCKSLQALRLPSASKWLAFNCST